MTEPPALSNLPYRSAPRVRSVLALLTAATFWTVTAELLPSGLMPSMSRDFGVSESMIGTLVSAWAVTIAVIGIPAVRLTIRVPRTTLLAGSLAITALANLLTALAPDFTIALSGRVLAAAAHGLFWAVVVSYVATIVEPQRLGRALSIVLAGPTLAGLVGLPAAAVIAEQAGWRTVFAGLAVVFVLTAVALRLILPRNAPTPTTVDSAAAWDRSARSVVFIAVGGGLTLVGHFAAFTYITTLVTGFGGLGRGGIPGVLLVLGAAGGIGVAISGLAADRFPRAALIATAALVVAGLALLGFGGLGPAMFVTGIMVWGFAIGAFPPILQTRVLRAATPTFRPLAGSIAITVLNVGIAAGAALGGFALDHGPGTLILAALVSSIAGAVVLALSRSGTPGTPSESR